MVAIGNFDGVHRGHAAVIKRAEVLAKKLGKPAAVLTFEPHPADFFAKKSVVFRLTPAEQKAQALDDLGLDGAIVMSFNADLASLTAEDFVADILVRRLGVSGVVAGYDFHFGKARSGTPAFLKDAGPRYGFQVEIVDRIAEDANGSLEAVSSTSIRNALAQGDMAKVTAYLGRDYTVTGIVSHGKKLGRTLGFPTANLELTVGDHVLQGIYAVRAKFDGEWHDGVASYGRRPTFDNGPALLEIFVFDYSGDLYGKTMQVALVEWLRGEEKFDSVEALIAQMNADSAKAKLVLAARK